MGDRLHIDYTPEENGFVFTRFDIFLAVVLALHRHHTSPRGVDDVYRYALQSSTDVVVVLCCCGC